MTPSRSGERAERAWWGRGGVAVASKIESSGRGRLPERILNAITICAVAAASYLVVTERVLPAVRGPADLVLEGERLSSALPFERLGNSPDGGSSESLVRAPGERPTLLLVFHTRCPACYRNLPAWRSLIDAGRGGVTTLAVGLDAEGRKVKAYARRHLAGAVAVRPLDRKGLLETLGVEIVPFTAVVGPDGVVEFAHHGSLDSVAVKDGIGALEALTGLSNR